MNVLFLDDGDTCLAPMACSLLRSALSRRPDADVHVDSAGLHVIDEGASPQAIDVMQDYELDLGDHRTKALSAELAGWADLILTMSGEQLRQVRARYPTTRDRSFRLTTYVDIGDELHPDLYGSSRDRYEEASDVLLVCLIKLAPKLGLSPEDLPEILEEGDDEPESLFEPWRTERPKPQRRPEKVNFFTGGLMRQQENAIGGGYRARHRLRICDFDSVEEYRELLDAVDEGEWVLECWRLGGELTPPANPYLGVAGGV